MKTKGEQRIAEINKHIRDGINDYADIMLEAEVKNWAVELNYFPRDIMNAVYIFQHVLSNVGIKNGHINAEKAVEFGNRLRELVKDMTGYDSVEIANETDESEKVSINNKDNGTTRSKI